MSDQMDWDKVHDGEATEDDLLAWSEADEDRER